MSWRNILRAQLCFTGMTKTAVTSTPLHPALAERWSTRALDPQFELSDGELTALLEAARWAPSANNSQPWRFGVARRGEPTFDALLEALAPGNRRWAHAASALLLLTTETVGADGSVRQWAAYDAGQAAAHLSTQATVLGLSVHQMGGFDTDAAAAVFALPASLQPLVVIAVGRRSDDVVLDEPFASRETARRERKPMDELVLEPAQQLATVAA